EGGGTGCGGGGEPGERGVDGDAVFGICSGEGGAEEVGLGASLRVDDVAAGDDVADAEFFCDVDGGGALGHGDDDAGDACGVEGVEEFEYAGPPRGVASEVVEYGVAEGVDDVFGGELDAFALEEGGGLVEAGSDEVAAVFFGPGSAVCG